VLIRLENFLIRAAVFNSFHRGSEIGLPVISCTFALIERLQTFDNGGVGTFITTGIVTHCTGTFALARRSFGLQRREEVLHRGIIPHVPDRLMSVDHAMIGARPPDLIVGTSSPVVAALKRATHAIPIVFVVVNDPVDQGFIACFARPGGNITGFTFVDFVMVGKWLEMLGSPPSVVGSAPSSRR
jgi:hypothetical protein